MLSLNATGSLNFMHRNNRTYRSVKVASHEACISQEVSSEPSVGPLCLQMVHSLTQEASRLLRQPLDVASVPLKATRHKLQVRKVTNEWMDG